MKRLITYLLFTVVVTGTQAQSFNRSELIRYEDYEELAAFVHTYRQPRLLSLDQWLTYSAEPNTVILDTRSGSMYNAKHVAGAIHLNFSDFTAANLEALIPNRNTRILIYCNNNFMANELTGLEDRYFPSKVSRPNTWLTFPDSEEIPAIELQPRRGYRTETTAIPTATAAKEYTLALNIPTFISLYGYGYTHVYELADLVNTTDPRMRFEGTAVENTAVGGIAVASSPSVLVHFDDYMQLIAEVKAYRQERLVSLDQFNALRQSDRTVVLDFRSKAQYAAKHVKGAIHLDFTEFTQATLDSLIPDKSTNVLIYCNNNFVTDLDLLTEDTYLPTKSYDPNEHALRQRRTLALNVPAFINLYGYGFRNVYELGETVLVNDARIAFEGTAVK